MCEQAGGRVVGSGGLFGRVGLGGFLPTPGQNPYFLKSLVTVRVASSNHNQLFYQETLVASYYYIKRSSHHIQNISGSPQNTKNGREPGITENTKKY